MPYFLDPTTKTSFGFVFDGTTQTFSGSYHDKARDVDLKGTGVLKAQPPPVGVKSKGGCVGGDMVPYQSQNPNNPGEGFLILVLCDADGSGGPSGDDFMAIQVLDGPYAGYLNSGTPNGLGGTATPSSVAGWPTGIWMNTCPVKKCSSVPSTPSC